MVEKIDKPQAPPAYQILPSKEAKDDESKREQYEEGEEHYQKGSGSEQWAKYRGRAMTIKPVRVPRDRIDRVLFKNTVLKSGMGILEAAVVWKDGRTTDPVLFLIPRPDEYMKIRLLKRGQVVPENYWAKGPEIEMGLVQMEPTSGSWGTTELKREAKVVRTAKAQVPLLVKMGLVDAVTRKFSLAMFIVYAAGLAVIILAIIFALR